MTYESTKLQRFDTYGVYTIHLSDEDRQRLLSADDPSSLVREILVSGGAPEPNQIVVRQSSADSIDDLINQIVEDVTHGGGGTPPPPDPPAALLFHQESGPHISRYIFIILPA